jgi:hypothetical protein
MVSVKGAAVPKLTKQEADYGKAKPDGDRCGECKWFEIERPNTCEIVEGDIQVNGWSKFWHDNSHRRGSRLARQQDRQRHQVTSMREKVAEPDAV